MRISLFIVGAFLCHTTLFGQQKITWKDLADVTFTEKFFPAYGEYFLYPSYGESVKKLENKQVVIRGYFLNIVPEENLYILSQKPMASCFFCGMAGPETAIEVQFKKKQSFKTDDILSISGTLKLNADDIEHFNYILTDCKVVRK
ncbi:hypothetical protein HN014_19645 [Aquimarina sp. TRL1]|uniref:hypothetical protein n=1 Tax=Aquimarina sp. (strain TRL1) TaxID=2736252 RepID=UPI00158B7153|nr:hypothetical protein [Aquimarina sp. TRL1]QKX07031.1 hypothetical protein HN014_19645 [Aquimarina sp. TRL1]